MFNGDCKGSLNPALEESSVFCNNLNVGTGKTFLFA